MPTTTTPRAPAPPRPPERHAGRRRRPGRPVFSRGDWAVYVGVAALFVLVNVRFWTWWLDPDHFGATSLHLVATFAFGYVNTVMPLFFWFFVARMRRPEHVAAPPGLRVAMITPCVPSSEPLEIVEAQLKALVAVEYPHDSWVLDEGGDPDVEALALRYGVRYFTRRGVERYNQSEAPFKAKTKAGNVNAWLDAVGEDYDFFVQLDIDHHPIPAYLDRTLGHFEDPAVAWVQAPSVPGINIERWTSRGLAEEDEVFQGPIQMGYYGNSHTPFIIGSHTTYRTSAIQEIGGYQPTRAEDHLDTIVLAAHGYVGVYVPEIIATGDGPEDLGVFLGQQFAWSYSITQVLRDHMRRLVRRLTPGQAFQVLFSQTWYPLSSIAFGTLWILPTVALVIDAPISSVELGEFVLYFSALPIVGLLMWWTIRSWCQPRRLNFSWRSLVLESARWPVVMWSWLNALIGLRRPYMITRKGRGGSTATHAWFLYGPFILLTAIGLAAALLVDPVQGPGHAGSHMVILMFEVVCALLLLTTTLALELVDVRRLEGIAAAVRARAGTVLITGGLYALTAVAFVVTWTPLTRAI